MHFIEHSAKIWGIYSCSAFVSIGTLKVLCEAYVYLCSCDRGSRGYISTCSNVSFFSINVISFVMFLINQKFLELAFVLEL